MDTSPATTPQDVQSVYSDLERDLLFQIILNMRHRKISVSEAQRLAQEFLTLLPAIDKEELFNKLHDLGEKYPEARAVYVKHAVPLSEEQRQQTLSTMLAHVRNGNIEQAIAIAKEARS